ncbi:CRISPR-associated Csd1 family protein [Aquabacterium commune]|uniref:CRISPR-associated Csd1 family protein n=1 Tax=Aquabacterium commune TaxID=70586 RepID=A0A4V3CVT6_9BURK|nr:CRISPR-associated Csd1 family protein [Aquabacterium commune]
MILQALVDYYDRSDEMAPDGWEWKRIPYIVEIKRDGSFVQLSSQRTGKKSSDVTASLVPKAEIRSGTRAHEHPNALWDHFGFVLGHAKTDEHKDIETARKQFEAFTTRVKSMTLQHPASVGLAAINQFYERGEYSRVLQDPNWPDCIKIAGCNLTFRLAGEIDLVLQDPTLTSLASSSGVVAGDAHVGVCLVSGDSQPIQQLHFPIGGVCEKPAPLSAINDQSNPAFSSFGKHQGQNFPVGQSAVFRYSTALNHLLRPNSRQRIRVGDETAVFWAQRQEDADVEPWFTDLFGEADDPDARTEKVRALFESIKAGRFDGARGENKFFVLGLAPNAARIAIRFWHVSTLADIAQQTSQWFDDLRIDRSPKDREFPSLKALLGSVCLATKERPNGDIDKLPPALVGDVMRAALTGSALPTAFFFAAVQRCRAEQRVTYLRAAVLKACINRSIRHANRTSTNPEKEITEVLDTSNPSVGYRLGRLFAALERTQEEASPGLNATIRDRYYGAASSTPVAVFTTLLRLKNHHLAKIGNKGRAVNLEKLMGEIVDGIGDFPPHMPLQEQGRFALGYYHQRQAFFTKNDPDQTNQGGN